VQNFFSSKRAVVFRRFLEVVYRDTPGERFAGFDRHSVHSSVMISLTPLFFAMMFASYEKDNVSRHEDPLFHIYRGLRGKNCVSNYLKTKDALFDQESVASLYAKVLAFQELNSKN
jgi:hypothetical protein